MIILSISQKFIHHSLTANIFCFQNAKTPTESNRNFRGFTTILEEAEEPDAAKLEERAKRFGLDPSEPRPILSKKIRNLYERYFKHLLFLRGPQ